MSFTKFANACRSSLKRVARLAGLRILKSTQNESSANESSANESSANKSSADSNSANSKKSVFKCVVEPIILALAAILCFTYPVASTLWNNKVSKEISVAYDKFNFDQAAGVRRKNLRKAREYNAHHKSIISSDPYDGSTNYMKTADYKEYERVLDEPMGIMGIVKIPKIGVKLPIYHGSSPDVLSRGAGHLYGTDLPVGGKNRHTVVTAHTGLTNATMFDELVDLKKGDYFYFDVQGKTLRYKVFRISVVDPEDISLLQREKGRDLATLLTCTPYGVNTQRLLVTGYRVLPDPVGVPGDKLQWPFWMTMFLIALISCAVVLATMIIAIVRKRRDNLSPRGMHLAYSLPNSL